MNAPLLRAVPIVLGVLASTGAAALEVNVVGLFPDKAVVQIDGGALKTFSAGQRIRDDILLVSADRKSATFDIQGERVELGLGQGRTQASHPVTNFVMIPADGTGHFLVDGYVNKMPVKFAVDTGATFISLSAREATRLGLEYRDRPKVVMETANGTAAAYRVKIDSVRVGSVVLNNIDAVVSEGSDLPVVLLGMSFLSRMDMRQEGATMTLTQRY